MSSEQIIQAQIQLVMGDVTLRRTPQGWVVEFTTLPDICYQSVVEQVDALIKSGKLIDPFGNPVCIEGDSRTSDEKMQAIQQGLQDRTRGRIGLVLLPNSTVPQRRHDDGDDDYDGGPNNGFDDFPPGPPSSPLPIRAR